MKTHPAQLLSIDVKELSFKSLREDFSDHEVPLGGRGKIRAGQSGYDAENQHIAVGLLFTVERADDESEEPQVPYELRIDIRGLFKIDADSFGNDEKRIEAWAGENAFYILMPYLREHVYALTQKAGFKPAILPLVEVPTFELPFEKPEK